MGDDTMDNEALVRLWLGGDDEAGGVWFDRTMPMAVDYLTVGLAIDDPRSDAEGAARGRERAQRKLWKAHFPGVSEEAFAALRRGDRLRTALALGLDVDPAQLRRWVADNQSAGVRLHRRHYPSLRRFIAGMVNDEQTAEDLANETFIDLSQQRAQIREFRPMMYAVAKYKVYAWYRRQMRRPVDVDSEGISEIPVGTTDQPERQAFKRADFKLLLRALHSLPLNQQMTLVLYRWEDMTAKEIGVVFDCPEGTIRGRIRLGLARLRMFLENPPPAADGTPSDTTELLEWFNSLQDKARGFGGEVRAEGPWSEIEGEPEPG